jgi:hypothetical protein
MPEYSRGHRLRVPVLKQSADVINACMLLDAVFIILSAEGIGRLFLSDFFNFIPR